MMEFKLQIISLARYICDTFYKHIINVHIRGCIQTFPGWPPGARTANGTAPCH